MASSVFVAVPNTGSIKSNAVPGLIHPTAPASGVSVHLRLLDVGMHCLNFNHLWCDALNERHQRGLTHFAMHHADIEAAPGWLDVLLSEMARVAADVLSVVIPIKDERGLTSTALADTEGRVKRRLTMHEVHRLPGTFETGDATHARNERLFINTGLWICRFDAPWVEDVCFRTFDQIHRREDGKFEAAELTEDWALSHWLHMKRLRVFATRKVAVKHHGARPYTNAEPWGTWTVDLGDHAWEKSQRAKLDKDH